MKKLWWVVGVILLVMALTACGTGGNSVDDAKDIDPNVIAKVNDTIVPIATFNKTFALVEYNYKMSYGEEVLSQEYNGTTLKEIIQSQILDNLIVDVLRTESAKAAGGKIEQEQIDAAYTKYYEAEVKPNPELITFFEAQGIDEAFIKSQIESQLYADLYLENIKKNNAKALEIDEATFDQIVAKVRARHILVDTKEAADAAIKRVASGEKFEDVAKEVSSDPGSGAAGGDLGFFMRGDMVESFEQVAFTLPIGQVSEPVESQFGFHVIRVDEVKTVADLKKEKDAEKDIETVRLNRSKELLDQLLSKEIEALLAAAKVERFETLINQPTTQK